MTETMRFAKEIAIDPATLNYVMLVYQNFVPLQRTCGFNELIGQYRGEGDFLDLVGTLLIFHELGRANKVCKVELVSGAGDNGDLWIKHKGVGWQPWNVKTSQYAPFRGGLNLFIKKEELHKNIFGYIQVFVHLDETPEPHTHIAGVCSQRGEIFRNHATPTVIPRTNHNGFKVPIERLSDFGALLQTVEDKF